MNIILLFLGKELSTFLGWIGTFSYLFAYFLLSINKLKVHQKIYHVLNIFGAIGLTYNALFLNDYPNVIVNIVWAIIALCAIFLIGRQKRN
jgi:hypothetical protein